MFPEPRVGVGIGLVRRGLATACIDLSDGLSTDLSHLCRASGVGAEIDAALLPIHPLAVAANEGVGNALDLAVNGGEDYELLFAAPVGVRVPRSLAGVRVSRIGTLVRGSRISLIGADGRRAPLEPGGWEHFAGRR